MKVFLYPVYLNRHQAISAWASQSSPGRSEREWFCAGIPGCGPEKTKPRRGWKNHFDLSFWYFYDKIKVQEEVLLIKRILSP